MQANVILDSPEFLETPESVTFIFIHFFILFQYTFLFLILFHLTHFLNCAFHCTAYSLHFKNQQSA